MFDQGWMRLVFGLLQFNPSINPLQTQAIYKILEGCRFLLVCGGERAGKSFLTAAITAMLLQPKNLTEPDQSPPTLCWLIGPDYNQARAEFSYLHDAFAAGDYISSASMPENKTSPWIAKTIWNLTIETKSSNDIRKIASYPPDVVVMCEAAQQSYEVWLKARGRVAQKRGHVIMSGTLEEGLPWYSDMLRSWKAPNAMGGFSISIPSWSNLVEFPGGYNDPELQQLRSSMPEDYFLERYAAEPQRSSNLVIPEFDWVEHVREIEPAPDIPVRLWIDPGKNAYVVLFVQVVGTSTYVLDRVYRRGAIAHEVIVEAMSNPLWPLVMLNKGSHGVIDIAGKHQYGMPSHVEIWKDEAGVVLRSNYVHQDVGRDVVRYRLRKDAKSGQPLLLFNSNMTNKTAPDGTAEDVLAEPGLWKWRDAGTNSAEPRAPVDKNNHAMKALGYGLYDEFGPVEQRKSISRGVQRGYWKTI